MPGFSKPGTPPNEREGVSPEPEELGGDHELATACECTLKRACNGGMRILARNGRRQRATDGQASTCAAGANVWTSKLLLFQYMIQLESTKRVQTCGRAPGALLRKLLRHQEQSWFAFWGACSNGKTHSLEQRGAILMVLMGFAWYCAQDAGPIKPAHSSAPPQPAKPDAAAASEGRTGEGCFRTSDELTALPADKHAIHCHDSASSHPGLLSAPKVNA